MDFFDFLDDGLCIIPIYQKMLRSVDLSDLYVLLAVLVPGFCTALPFAMARVHLENQRPDASDDDDTSDEANKWGWSDE